jgi:hypothetical protein
MTTVTKAELKALLGIDVRKAYELILQAAEMATIDLAGTRSAENLKHAMEIVRADLKQRGVLP